MRSKNLVKYGLLALAPSAVHGFAVGNAAVTTTARTAMRAMSTTMADSFYDFEATAIDGKKVSMSDFKGKPVLILNVASL